MLPRSSFRILLLRTWGESERANREWARESRGVTPPTSDCDPVVRAVDAAAAEDRYIPHTRQVFESFLRQHPIRTRLTLQKTPFPPSGLSESHPQEKVFPTFWKVFEFSRAEKSHVARGLDRRQRRPLLQ